MTLADPPSPPKVIIITFFFEAFPNNKIHYFYVILKIGKPLRGSFLRFREKKKFAVFLNHPLYLESSIFF